MNIKKQIEELEGIMKEINKLQLHEDELSYVETEAKLQLLRKLQKEISDEIDKLLKGCEGRLYKDYWCGKDIGLNELKQRLGV